MVQNMFDDVVYSPELLLDGVHLVEASAGTGKTYSIQNIYARLIMEKGLKASEIVVMTYTDAATKELRDRLHQILQDIQARFSGKSTPEEDEKKRKERDDRADRLIYCAEDKDSARMRVELALLEFDKSTISTIHGFCQRVLARYAFDAGIDFVQQIEDNKTAELNVLADDWWRKQPADALKDIKLSTLKKYIRKLSGKAENDISEHSEKKENSTKETKKTIDQRKAKLLLSTAKRIVDTYERARSERKTLNFDDLLRALKDALRESNPRSGHLIAQLRNEFKAALIDEFQDTDPVQYEIFDRIFLNGNTNPLFFVGDPKQAIYAFRGGDIYTYLEAKSKLDGNQIFSLTVNFRSTRRMIEAVNGMFLDGDGGKTFGHDLIGYECPVQVPDPPKVRELSGEEPLRIIEFPVQAPPCAKANMQQVIDLMVKEILHLLDLKNVQDGKAVPVFSPGDIAILTNSNERNREIHQKLQHASIPSVVRKSGNVFASPAARELWIFLRAVDDPADKEAVCCAATTVFCDGSVSGCPNMDDPELFAKYVEHFRALNLLWWTRGLAALTAELEKHHYRQHLAGREDGERQLSDMSQIWELCFSAMKQLGSSPEKLISWLEERISNAPVTKNAGEEADPDDESDTEEYSRELESDEDAVKIMTIHTAKGLQFPVVLLPDCWNFVRGVESPYEFHAKNHLFFSVDEVDKPGAATEIRQETTRLLYVAMTRAKQQMVIFTPAVDPEEPPAEDAVQKIMNKIQKEPLTGLLDNLKKRCQATPPYTVVPAGKGGYYGKYDPVRPEPLWQNALPPPGFSLRPSKGSFSSLFQTGKGHTDPDGLDRDEQTAEVRLEPDDSGTEHRIFSLPMGTELGSCWHNIFEKVPFDADDERIRELVGEELANSGFRAEKDMLEATSEMVRKTLKLKIKSPSGEFFSLREIPWEDRLSEQPFDFSSVRACQDTGELKQVLEKYWGGDSSGPVFLRMLSCTERPLPRGFMTGIADLIFRYHGFYYIVDWKSNGIGGKVANFSESGVRNEMAKHLYFLQYLLYATVLHFYLKQRMGDRYSWEKNFGGIRYFFLRGIAAGGTAPVFADRPKEAMLEELGNVLGVGGR